MPLPVSYVLKMSAAGMTQEDIEAIDALTAPAQPVQTPPPVLPEVPETHEPTATEILSGLI